MKDSEKYQCEIVSIRTKLTYCQTTIKHFHSDLPVVVKAISVTIFSGETCQSFSHTPVSSLKKKLLGGSMFLIEGGWYLWIVELMAHAPKMFQFENWKLI